MKLIQGDGFGHKEGRVDSLLLVMVVLFCILNPRGEVFNLELLSLRQVARPDLPSVHLVRHPMDSFLLLVIGCDRVLYLLLD